MIIGTAYAIGLPDSAWPRCELRDDKPNVQPREPLTQLGISEGLGVAVRLVRPDRTSEHDALPELLLAV
eukprot:tig00000808_g4409.t1